MIGRTLKSQAHSSRKFGHFANHPADMATPMNPSASTGPKTSPPNGEKVSKDTKPSSTALKPPKIIVLAQVTDIVSAPLTAQRLFALVSAADKYDCLPAFRLQIRALMDMHFDKVAEQPGLEQAVLRAATAYLLRDRKYFQLATNQLIVRFNPPMSSLRREPGGDILPTSALLAIGEKRSYAQRVIDSRLGQGGYACDCGEVVGGCEYHDDLLGTFGVHIWPPEFRAGEVTVAQMLETMKKERALASADQDCCGIVKVDFMELADEVEGICEGLCVESVRADAHEDSGKPCKHASRESA